MSRHRFNLYGIGSRHPKLYETFEEVSWWSSPDERIIASAGRDLIDHDFSWAVLVRDKIGRFRAVKVDCSYPTLSAVEKSLWQVMADTLQSEDLTTLGLQGDEPNSSVNLLRLATDCDFDALHPYL